MDSDASRPQMTLVCALLLVGVALTLGPAPVRAQGQPPATAQPAAVLPKIAVINDGSGSRLQVDGRDFLVKGMNWDYIPIGTNYSFDLWSQPEDVITTALDREMSLMQTMGVNAIRQGAGIPPRWVRYIYERYGIFTVINDVMGRYGLTVNGIWRPVTDYSDPVVRKMLVAQMAAEVDQYRDTPGVLLWLLGNENNYGLSWRSFEIEALPEGERDVARARYLYSLYGEVIQDVHRRDPGRPVAIANGDVQYIDLVAQECKGLDVFGTNVYRGISARDLFQVVHDKLGLPVLFTEFGSDAFNAVSMQEDQAMQARYLIGQWREIYEQAAGRGRAGNAIGGMIFQWSDGWWKFGQDSRLDVHDTNASWPNGGYAEDFRPGENNMNEEWWGITAKGLSDARGLFDVYPRAAYYALREAWRMDPYAAGSTLKAIDAHFAGITPMGAVLEARGDAASLQGATLSKVRVSGLRLEFRTFSTGGKNVSTPESSAPRQAFPSFRGFDSGQSFWADFEAKPSDAVIGRLSLNVLGRVPRNPIDEIFYENRGRPRSVLDENGQPFEVDSFERIKVYQSSLSWDDHWFNLEAFYRVGHLHWQYEGDFFGLYRDAFYGPNIDIYNGEAPVGFEIAGKKTFRGLKAAFGPQLWWGANPAVFLKYSRPLGRIQWTGVFQNDFARQSQVTSSVAIPERSTRKASLQMETPVGPFSFAGGVLWSGQPRVGERFQMVDMALINATTPLSPSDIKEDRIKDGDAFGFKGKMILQKGRWNWYGQAAYMGVVAEGGPTTIPTFTGWELRDSGSGNQVNALTGLAATYGVWQIGPNFLWQKPIVGPMPSPAALAGTAGRPRNILSDPFAVRGNRETAAGEFMITYDPTPGSWLWAWDSDAREDAPLAASLDFKVLRHRTTADAGLFISGDGQVFPFPGATPARNLWEVHGRVVNRLGDRARMVSHLYLGTVEPNGADTRLVHNFGWDSRIAWPRVALAGFLKFNDYGPYDYHRDFNLTYPMQAMVDVSTTLGAPRWFYVPQTRLGVRATYRTLNRFSNRYRPEGAPAPIAGQLFPAGLPDGNEWEIATYLMLSM